MGAGFYLDQCNESGEKTVSPLGFTKLNTAAADPMSSSYSEEEIERCTLTGKREILFQIRSLIRQSPRVSVIFDEGRESFLSVLIDISADDTTLYFDRGGSEETNRAFLNSSRCQFVGNAGGIRTQFAGEHPKLVKLPSGEQVFAVAVPSSLLRLQRRDTFRLQMPMTKPYLCRIQLEDPPKELALPIYDISVGGVGFLFTEEPPFETMRRLDECVLDLRESGLLRVVLEVRYILATQSRQDKPIWHVGCSFPKLSSAAETTIQRFMAKIEIERRALAID